MNQDSPPPAVQASVPFLQLRLAQMGLQPLQAEQQNFLDEWLVQMSALAEEDASDLALGAELVTSLDRVTFSATANSAQMIPVLVDYFLHLSVARSEMDAVAEVGTQIDPERLCSWIDVGVETMNAGWMMPQPLPVQTVQDLSLSQSDRAPAIWAWCQSHEIGEVQAISRGVGAGNPYTQLAFPLPASTDRVAPVHTALQLFESLQLPLLPDDVLAVIMNGTYDALSLVLRMTQSGISQIGIAAHAPSRMFSLDLCQSVGVEDFEPLALFEATLGVDEPSAVEAQVTGAGPSAKLHYRVVSIL